MKEYGQYAGVRGVMKCAVNIWANSWLFACMVLDLLAQYSQKYVLFGICNWGDPLCINTRDLSFRHKEPRVWNGVGWMDNGRLTDEIPKIDSELLTQFQIKRMLLHLLSELIAPHSPSS